MVDKLVDECDENIEEVKIAKITIAKNENSYKCSFYIVYMVLFFTINVGIIIYYVYSQWYLKKILATC